jgi:hypothetical protein
MLGCEMLAMALAELEVGERNTGEIEASQAEHEVRGILRGRSLAA